jgi:MFS family permease
VATSTASAPPQREPATIDGDRWRRDFHRLLGGSAVSLLGSISLLVSVPVIALQQSGPVLAAWVAAAATLPNLLCHLPAGLLVDRWDKRRLMLACQTLRTVTSLGAAILLLADGTFRPWVLLVVAAVNGVCMTFYSVAEIAVLPQLLPRDEITRGMATNEMRVNSALLFGRPLGGLLVAAGPAAVYGTDALLGLGALLALKGVRAARPALALEPTWQARQTRQARPSGPADPGRSTRRFVVIGDLAEALSWLRGDRFVRSALTVVTVTNALFQIVALLLIVRACERSVPPFLIGVLLTAPAIGGCLLSGYAAWSRSARCPMSWRPLPQPRSPLTLLCAALMVWLAATALLAASSSLAIWMVAWGVVGSMGTWLNIVRAEYNAEWTPGGLHGRVAGITRLLTQGAAPLGTLAGGYLIAAAGCRLVGWLVAATIAALGALLWAGRRLSLKVALRLLRHQARYAERRLVRPRRRGGRGDAVPPPLGAPLGDLHQAARRWRVCTPDTPQHLAHRPAE